MGMQRPRRGGPAKYRLLMADVESQCRKDLALRIQTTRPSSLDAVDGQGRQSGTARQLGFAQHEILAVHLDSIRGQRMKPPGIQRGIIPSDPTRASSAISFKDLRHPISVRLCSRSHFRMLEGHLDNRIWSLRQAQARPAARPIRRLERVPDGETLPSRISDSALSGIQMPRSWTPRSPCRASRPSSES